MLGLPHAPGVGMRIPGFRARRNLVQGTIRQLQIYKLPSYATAECRLG